MTALLLALIGIVLAGPFPAALGRCEWPYRSPRAGIVLWQSLALAAVLAVIGAGLATALWLVTGPQLDAPRIVAHFTVLCLTALVIARLVWSAIGVARDTRLRRRRHRDLVDLLAVSEDQLPDVQVLAEKTPIAYCLPGLRKSRVVVTSGALTTLDDDELAAVLAHERAHVRARHDLVLEAFNALHQAFPRGPNGVAALRQAHVMVELLADDRARRQVDAGPLARALLQLSTHPVPAGSLGLNRSDDEAAAFASNTMIRMRRLAEPSRRHLRVAAACYALSTVVLVGPTLTLAVPWIVDSWRQLQH